MQNNPQSPFLNAPPTSHILEVPQKVTCPFEPQISAYRCQFEIFNRSVEQVFVNVTSTFMQYMEMEGISQLAPGERKIVIAKIRPPNQLYPLQFIGISYTLTRPASHFSIFDPSHQKITIKLEFVTEMIEQNAQLDSILKQYSQNQYEEAKKLFRLAQYKAAIEKSQEAFVLQTLYRKNLRPLITMALAELKLGSIEKAMGKCQLVLYYPEHAQYYKAAMIKIEAILAIIPTTEIKNKLAYVKNLMHILKNIIENNMLQQDQQKKCTEMMTKLQQHRHTLLSEDHHSLFQQLLDRAITEYPNNPSLSQTYKDQKQFTNFLHKLINKTHKNQQETPQYALDPINYEIFMDPVMTPTGLSYEKDFIVSFFQKHGPKDPYTREYLDPGSVVSNITLKILVRNHPNLNKWIKYEQQSTKI